MESLVKLNNVSYKIAGRSILTDISFAIEDGEILTVLGPNGAGKTTLLKVLTGLLKPNTGTVSHRPNLKSAYVPQKFRMPDSMPMRVCDFLTSNSALSLDQALQNLDKFNLNIDFDMQQAAQSLSGGETQRLLLARALLSSPELLILDEPSQGYDYALQARFYDTLREVREKQNCSILLVSHDLNLVMSATDRVICLNQHICCQGNTQDISTSPEYLNLFGLNDTASAFAVYHHEHDHQHADDGSIISPPDHHHE